MLANNPQLGSIGGFVVLALIGLGLWILLSPRSSFVIRTSAGKTWISRGKVSGSFVAEVEDILRRAGVEAATVRGDIYGTKRHIKLRFSRTIPPPVRQQIRNAWHWA